MKERCLNPNSRTYVHYGGRGIKVCDRWRVDFSAFLADMGECPAGHSIDRIDNGGNYEPGNCRWATPATQGRNTRVTKLREETVEEIRALRAGMSVKELAVKYGVSTMAIYRALKPYHRLAS